MTTAEQKLKDEIQAAQVVFVTAASRLLDEAEDVRQHRDRLLKLLEDAGNKKPGAGNAE